MAALKAAQPGDVVRLAPGSYGTVTIENVAFAQYVTITSADASAPAVIDFLNIRNASGLWFYQVDIQPRPGVTGAQVANSVSVVFDDVHFHGQLDGNLAKDGSGITVMHSFNVTITNSEFNELSGALTHINVDGLNLTSNRIHDLRSDGFIGTGSDNVVISNNTFTDFYPTGGVHPDAIQMWTAKDGPSRHITITDNTITRGAGDIIQGIFITNEGGTGYQNVTISGNALTGTMFHGITLERATDAVIENNLVLGFKDMVSRITIKNSTNVTEQNNQATAYVISGNVNHTDLNNKTIVQAVVGDTLVLDAWRYALAHPDAPVAPAPAPTPEAPPPVTGGGFELPDFGSGGFGGFGPFGGAAIVTDTAPPQAGDVLFPMPTFGGWLFL